MNTSKLIATAAVLAALAIGGHFLFRRLQHARHDLVTLHVRDMALSKVLASIARQTRETIVATRSLDIPVHLDVSAAPLAEVLELLAEQAGGFWRRTDAVHRSEDTLAGLIRAIETGTEGTPAGWTNPAPKFAFPPDDLAAAPDSGPGSPVPRRLPLRVFDDARAIEGPPGSAPGDAAAEVRVTRPGPTPQGRPNAVKHGRPEAAPHQTTLVFRKGEGDGEVTTIDLSPTRLLVEQVLVPKVTDLCTEPPDAALAKRMAARVGGQHSVLYSLEPAPVPGPLAAGRFHHRTDFSASGEPRRSLRVAGSGPNHAPPGTPPDIDAEIRRHRYDRLSRLTPEQRARQQSDRAPRETDRGGDHSPGVSESVDIQVNR